MVKSSLARDLTSFSGVGSGVGTDETWMGGGVLFVVGSGSGVVLTASSAVLAGDQEAGEGSLVTNVCTMLTDDMEVVTVDVMGLAGDGDTSTNELSVVLGDLWIGVG